MQTARIPTLVLPLLVLFTLAGSAFAQPGSSRDDVRRVRRLDAPQTNLWTVRPRPPVLARPDLQPGAGARPAIMLTGYWPPTNEMIRRFSDDPIQNPQGWIGSNWEGRGYDVYAYFPEFVPPNCTSCGQGSGDLQVDYQDTSADFWPLADALQPIAIITFSRGGGGLRWEVEMNQYNRDLWVPDYRAPTRPTPTPPDSSVPAGFLRLSMLPVQEIVDAIDLGNLGLFPFICFSGSGGGFLSEFIAYHGVWYQSLHDSPLDPAWCIAAGHVHVGAAIDWATATRAAETTLRAVIHHVDAVLDPPCQDVLWYCPTSTNSAGSGAYLTTTGSTSIAGNGLTLVGNYGPPGKFGLIFYGSGPLQGTLGDGTLCVAAPAFRVPPLFQFDGAGFMSRTLDFTQPPFSQGAGMVTAGSTWWFQLWYRDAQGGPAGYNGSSALEITFCP